MLKDKRNITKFGYVYVTRFHITLTNFPDDKTNSLTIIILIFFFENGILKNVKKLKFIQKN